MHRMLILLLLPLLVSAGDVYDLRIHEGAEKGTRLTMGIAMQRKLEGMKNCFGQLDADIPWLDYKSSRNAFYTNADVGEARNGRDLIGTLHLLCAGNRIQSLDFNVHVTHRNHHPPTFSKSNYNIYAPMTLGKDALVAKIDVTDNDPVIYNSERQLSFTEDQSIFSIQADGKILLKQPLGPQIPYKPIRLQVLAIDYGSPQLYTIANVTITPVTVSAVRDLRVNIATKEYQIFEWELPEYGHASKFRLTIRKGNDIIHEEEFDGKAISALTKLSITPAGNFSYQVVATDMHGSTPTEWKTFTLFHTRLDCKGECSSGGIPLCYYGSFNRPEQFKDHRGAHCLCFSGYIGVGCDKIATCAMEKTVDAYGGLDWEETNANVSLRVPCPYNSEQDNQWLERVCHYERDLERAVWGRAKEHDKCKLQSSVLTHLGMLGTFATNANSVSTIHTVARFIRDLLAVPAFSQRANTSAHFDQKIAENIARVVEEILAMNLDELQGNSTMAKIDLWEAVRELGRRLPVPFSVASPDHHLHMKALSWHKHSDPLDTPLGTRCRLSLPKVNPNQVLRGICMTNASLFDVIEPSMPILSLEVDKSEPFQFTRFTIMLKPKDFMENYTCVYYDPGENGWSTKGIRRVDPNFHGYVRCETNHLGVFSLLPDRLFVSNAESLREVTKMAPTATTLVAAVCSVFILLTTGAQRNIPFNITFLVFLFFVFMIHVAHFAVLLAGQIGDPLVMSPVLQLILQFSILSISASLYLLVSSLNDIINSKERQKEKDDELTCCVRPCALITLAFILPGILTFTTYYFVDDYDNDLSRVLDRIDWLFLLNYLAPVAFFFSLTIIYAFWNIYLGTLNKARSRATDSNGSVVKASSISIFMVFLLAASVVLFNFREQNVWWTVLFCASQLLYYFPVAFCFMAYMYRIHPTLQGETDGSCRSLERKRDISRALLDHADMGKRSDDSGSRSPSDVYLQLSQHLYERTPMVSIV